jgi:hypothetical protein
VFAALDKENPRPKKDKPDEDQLLKLLSACRNYDMDSADAVMDEIEKFSYESDDGLAYWLRDNIDIVNFKEVEQKLSSLLEKGE